MNQFSFSLIKQRIPEGRELLPREPKGTQKTKSVIPLRQQSQPNCFSLTPQLLGTASLRDQTVITSAQLLQKQVFRQDFSRLKLVRQLSPNFIAVNHRLIGSQEVQPLMAGNQASLESREELTFDSQFQCGNLYSASRVAPRSYGLLIRNDYNSRKFRQWFFFKAYSRCDQLVTLRICNFVKTKSLFSSGMKIACKSSRKNEWERGGSGIAYSRGEGSSYVLRFSYSFSAEETVHFAYSLPYTHKDLGLFLDQLQARHLNNRHFQRRQLCTTLMGNSVELLSVRGKSDRPRKVVFLFARIHPGQTVSSIIAEGFILKLMETKEGELLRQHFDFFIVPMLNVDGVVLGNYRCSLAGKDLNRSWHKPDKRLHPEIFYLKKLITKHQDRVFMVLDLHSHSKAMNFFSYALLQVQFPHSRLYPAILSKLSQGFDLSKCSFDKGVGKAGTARVVLSKKLNIENVFTIECSFCGGSASPTHFSYLDYARIGETLLEGIAIQSSPDSSLKKQAVKAMKQIAFKQIEELSESEASQDSCTKEQLEQFFSQPQKSVLKEKQKRLPNNYRARHNVQQADYLNRPKLKRLSRDRVKKPDQKFRSKTMVAQNQELQHQTVLARRPRRAPEWQPTPIQISEKSKTGREPSIPQPATLRTQVNFTCIKLIDLNSQACVPTKLHTLDSGRSRRDRFMLVLNSEHRLQQAFREQSQGPPKQSEFVRPARFMPGFRSNLKNRTSLIKLMKTIGDKIQT